MMVIMAATMTMTMMMMMMTAGHLIAIKYLSKAFLSGKSESKAEELRQPSSVGTALEVCM